MATEEGMIVRFKADTSDVEDGAKKAGKALEDFGKRGSAASYLARDAINDLSHELRDLPYAISNPAMLAGPFGKLQALMFDLKQQTGSTEGAFKALSSSIMGGGGLLLAGNLLVSAIAILGPKLFSASEAASKLKLDINKLSPAFIEMSSGITDVAAGLASKDFAVITKLQAVLTDLNLPLKQRNEALTEFNKLADKQNQLNESDINNISKINTAIESQIELYTRRAMVMAAQEKIQDLSKIIFDTQFKIDTFRPGPDNNKTFTSLDKAGSQYDAFSKHVENAKGRVDTLMKGFINWSTGFNGIQEGILEKIVGSPQAFNEVSDKVSKAKSQIEQLFYFIQQQVQQGAKFGTVLGGLDQKQAAGAEFNFFDRYFKLNPKTASDKAKEAAEMWKTAVEYAIKNLNVFAGLDTILSAPNRESGLKAAKEWWDSYQAGLIKFKVPQLNITEALKLTPKIISDESRFHVDEFIEGQKNLFEGKNIAMSFIDPSTINRSELIFKYQQLFASIGSSLPNILTYKNDLGKDVSIPLKQITNIKQLHEALSQVFDKTKTSVETIAGLVGNTMGSAFTQLFTAIEQGKAPLQAFFLSIGQSVEQLISKLIAAAIEALVLSALTGGDTSFGSTFAHLTGINVGKHAAGGIAYGPSLGMIGEYANAGSNPEVIAPLSKLKSIMGNAQGVKASESRIYGTDIILSQKRTNKYLQRLS